MEMHLERAREVGVAWDYDTERGRERESEREREREREEADSERVSIFHACFIYLMLCFQTVFLTCSLFPHY